MENGNPVDIDHEDVSDELEGFANAIVRLSGFRDPVKKERRYVLTINEGKAIRLRNIRFSGVSEFDVKTLVRQIRGTLVEKQASLSGVQ